MAHFDKSPLIDPVPRGELPPQAAGHASLPNVETNLAAHLPPPIPVENFVDSLSDETEAHLPDFFPV